MPHPLLLGLFDDHASAAEAARAVRALGVTREQLSVISRSHQEAGALARALDASPGADIEDSRPAARLGELGGQILAAIALVMPGIGPIVAAGPLAAELGEAAGHMVGGIAAVLERSGVSAERASAWQRRVEEGAVLLAAHVINTDLARARDALERGGARDLEVAQWE